MPQKRKSCHFYFRCSFFINWKNKKTYDTNNNTAISGDRSLQLTVWFHVWRYFITGKPSQVNKKSLLI